MADANLTGAPGPHASHPDAPHPDAPHPDAPHPGAADPGSGASPVIGDLAARKRGHIQAVLHGAVGFASLTTGLEGVRLRHRALPARDLSAVDVSTAVFGHRLRAPLLVSCMTGGVSEAGAVNRALAAAAQGSGLAMGLGSGRAVLEDASTAGSFQVRDVAPDVLLLANLGAVQLHTYTVDDCEQLVRTCDADVLVLHLNAVQEAVQPGGDTEFGGLTDRIAEVASVLQRRGIPVVVKEVGFGMADADLQALVAAGVAGIDVAGAGGTNWARVEAARDSRVARVADAFADWGRPTAECVAAARRAVDAGGSGTVVIGSGGIADGVDAVKALCLGADLVGVARGLLAAAVDGPDAATAAVADLVRQLTVAVWAVGAGSVADLGPQVLDRPGD